jgi:hypothetical protein
MNETIEVNGKKYVLESSIKNTTPAKSLKGKPYVIVRTYSAGVFAGYLDKRVGEEAKILQARRLWYWKGAASLSQLAVDGVKCPAECKFSKPVDTEVTEVIEVLQVSKKAQDCIAGVKEWEA